MVSGRRGQCVELELVRGVGRVGGGRCAFIDYRAVRETVARSVNQNLVAAQHALVGSPSQIDRAVTPDREEGHGVFGRAVLLGHPIG